MNEKAGNELTSRRWINSTAETAERTGGIEDGLRLKEMWKPDAPDVDGEITGTEDRKF